MADSVTEPAVELPKYYITQAYETDSFSWRVYERRGGWGAKPIITGLTKERAESMLEALLSEA